MRRLRYEPVPRHTAATTLGASPPACSCWASQARPRPAAVAGRGEQYARTGASSLCRRRPNLPSNKLRDGSAPPTMADDRVEDDRSATRDPALAGRSGTLDRTPCASRKWSSDPLQEQENRAAARFVSPLPDSNRRPLPYHGGPPCRGCLSTGTKPLHKLRRVAAACSDRHVSTPPLPTQILGGGRQFRAQARTFGRSPWPTAHARDRARWSRSPHPNWHTESAPCRSAGARRGLTHTLGPSRIPHRTR